MEILGIGPSELVFIVVIALIILGPREMQKAGRTIGTWLRRVVTSDGWKLFQQTSREIQTLPNRLMREAALEELKDVQHDLQHLSEPDQRFMEQSTSSDAGPRTTPGTNLDPEPKILPHPTASETPRTDEEPDA
jgi:sec-independent protein translocase protein TatB